MVEIKQFHSWKVDIEVMDFDDLKEKMMDDTFVQCPDCHTYLIWDNIPDENIIKETERENFWGAPCYYDTVAGYICPECGERIEF